MTDNLSHDSDTNGDAEGENHVTSSLIKVPVSVPLLWQSLRDWRLAAGSGLVPSIQVFRSVRDYSQRA